MLPEARGTSFSPCTVQQPHAHAPHPGQHSRSVGEGASGVAKKSPAPLTTLAHAQGSAAGSRTCLCNASATRCVCSSSLRDGIVIPATPQQPLAPALAVPRCPCTVPARLARGFCALRGRGVGVFTGTHWIPSAGRHQLTPAQLGGRGEPIYQPAGPPGLHLRRGSSGVGALLRFPPELGPSTAPVPWNRNNPDGVSIVT